MRIFVIALFALLSVPVTAQQTIGTLLNNPGTYDGFTLFTARKYHTSYLINNEGRIINSWAQNQGKRVENCRLLDNGQLVRAVNLELPYFAGHAGAHGRIELVNWDGSISWSMEYADNTHILHHEVIPIKQTDGSYHFLASSWDKTSANDAVLAGRNPNAAGGSSNYILTERILEIEPVGSNGYNIVWEWNVMDHLVQEDYPSAGNYIVNGVSSNPQLMDFNHYKVPGNPDWLHVNGLDYNADLDQIIITQPGFDEFIIIDHSTTTSEAAGHTGGDRGKGGDLLYRWGNHNPYDAGNTKFFDALHAAYWIPQGYTDAGKIMAINNGRSGIESEIVIVESNIDAMGNYDVPATGMPFQPLNSHWVYSDGSNFHSRNMGNGQRLPNGNTLINEAVKGRFFEIDANDNIVWEYICPTIGSGPMAYDIPLSSIPTSNAGGDLENEVFKTIKYPIDYSGLSGQDLTPGDFVELNNPLTIAELSENEDQIVIYPNPNSGIFHIAGDFTNSTVQVLSVSGAQIKTFTNQGGSTEIDIRDQPAGLFFVKVINHKSGSISFKKVNKW